MGLDVNVGVWVGKRVDICEGTGVNISVDNDVEAGRLQVDRGKRIRQMRSNGK